MIFSEASVKEAREKYQRILGNVKLELQVHDMRELDKMRGSFYMIRNPTTSVCEFFVDEVLIQPDDRVPVREIRLLVDGVVSQEWEL